ncbi:putative transcription factor B3-Domain family [Rosa chinensis]|uniref:Putative transcription factor B3-Domain family n=1 Tax=Rosa chinensis TaxID=74649 RepID=A0A2P6P2Y8_ROSCH|nr:putative transcription factor B3-Domain family [Rosa chinensis]
MATSSRLLASCSSQRCRKGKFPDEFPSFCVKIVTNDDLRDGKMYICNAGVDVPRLLAVCNEFLRLVLKFNRTSSQLYWELPETAVRKYGNCMADHIFLEVPNCGKPWEVELRTSALGGRMWLLKGWQEFANFYSLDQGCFPVFSYEGKQSHFQVRIFHWKCMEMDYPIRRRVFRPFEIHFFWRCVLN